MITYSFVMEFGATKMNMGLNNQRNLTFSQRIGIEPLPTQLKLEEISDDHRRLIDLYVSNEIKENTDYFNCFKPEWDVVAREIHVWILKQKIGDIDHYAYQFREKVSKFIYEAKYNKLFEFVEFICAQDNCSNELKANLANSFEKTYSAYRLVDSCYVVAISTKEQAVAYLEAIEIATKQDATGPRAHLINAGKYAADQSWNDSVRESIQSVLKNR